MAIKKVKIEMEGHLTYKRCQQTVKHRGTAAVVLQSLQ